MRSVLSTVKAIINQLFTILSLSPLVMHHCANAEDEGVLMDATAEEPVSTSSPIDETDEGTVREVSAVQSENALSPMLVTLEEITAVSIAVQL